LQKIRLFGIIILLIKINICKPKKILNKENL